MEKRKKEAKTIIENTVENGFQNNRVAVLVCGAIFLIWTALIILCRFLYPEYVAAVRGSYEDTNLLLVVFLAELIVLFRTVVVKHKQLSDGAICWSIFALALVFRLAALPFGDYEPNSDFMNYFNIGRDFALYGFDGTYNIADGYQIPSFAGLKVLNGILAKIFSPTLTGFVVSNCVITSLICVMIFLVGRQVNRLGAILGACLYGAYPCSMISSQITSNQHGATLFLLVGIYFYDQLLKSKKIDVSWFLICAASAACFLVSNFFHPSIIITLLAVSAYTIICVFGKLLEQKKFGKKCIRLLITLMAVLVFYSGFNVVSMSFLESKNLFNSESSSINPFSKIVVGLNHTTMGMWSPDDYGYIGSFPEEEQLEVCLEMIADRTKNVDQTLDLLSRKLSYFTFEADNYFGFYLAGCVDPIEAERLFWEDAYHSNHISEFEYQCKASELQTQKEAYWRWYLALGEADAVYIYIVTTLALFGLIDTIRKQKYNVMYLVGFVYVGWSMFVTISELQTRYRYQAVAALMLFAGMGITFLWELISSVLKNKLPKQENHNNQVSRN